MTTLATTAGAYGGHPGMIKHFMRLEPANYEQFVEVLEEDLDELIGMIESDAKDFHDASEDEINREIVRLLRARLYIASHDHDEGGHVDVRVQSRDGKYSWLAEAKLDNGPAYLHKGIDQLLDRYLKGTPNHNRGAFLIYIQKDNCSGRFANWRAEFENNPSKLQNLAVGDCAQRPGLAFKSEFHLDRLGTGVPKYALRHIAVSAFRPASAAPVAAPSGSSP